MSPPPFSGPNLGPAPTVTRILRDPSNRAIVAALAEDPHHLLDVAGLQSKALPDLPARFLRDRLRQLGQLGVVARAPADEQRGTGATATWILTAAGQDLHRVHALVTRIVTRAGAARVAASAHRRELAVDTVIDALADPATLRILSELAASDDPMDPDALEDACRPVTRRTLYRRLRILQDEGLVGRLVTHEVPRRTHYAIQDRWRPVAGVLLLSAWWELRHGAQETQTFDLALLVHLVVPVAKVARAQSGSVTATVINGAEQASVRIEVRDGHLHTSALSGSADAEAVGSALAWATALVTDDRAALTITGSADLATAVIASVRAALLAYVR